MFAGLLYPSANVSSLIQEQCLKHPTQITLFRSPTHSVPKVVLGTRHCISYQARFPELRKTKHGNISMR